METSRAITRLLTDSGSEPRSDTMGDVLAAQNRPVVLDEEAST
jgi:hypothetical protein